MKTKIAMMALSVVLLAGCSGNSPELGIKNGQLFPCPKTPNCVSTQAVDSEHSISTIELDSTQQETQDKLLILLNDWDRTKITIVRDDYIRAEFTSQIFRFVDDVEFYFPINLPHQTVIQMRSASRLGYSDLGANSKRIELIRKHLTSKH